MRGVFLRFYMLESHRHHHLLLQQPFVQQEVMMPMAFEHVEPEEHASHGASCARAEW